MAKLIIDTIEVDVPPEATLLQACEAAGIEIPRFCFHERLSVAGNCRMCLVEIKGGPKPVASCAWAVKDCRPGADGSAPVILTQSPMVQKARHGVMEFLLINHPLDCPICDQGGECDLQDQAMAYGVGASRFYENKRAVEDKDMGPLIKTSMNRCIHCTRCVRFTTEVAGTGDMGAIGRGEDMEIMTYLESALTSELQGCVADLCPVGALLSKPFSFKARSWELNKTHSVDVMDGLGSAIRIDVRGREVMRILPRVNEAINEEWISDKTRHIVDGLKVQRLDRPYYRDQGRLRPATWGEVFDLIAARIHATTPERIGGLIGDLASVEEMFAFQQLLTQLGSKNIDCRQDSSCLHPRFGRQSYLFNPQIQGIEKADALLIIGSDPRKESPVLNARLRKRWRRGNLPIALIGPQVDLTYPYIYLGDHPQILDSLARGEEGFGKSLAQAQRPLIIVGPGALIRDDSLEILRRAQILARREAENWNGLAILHTAASRVGGLDLGCVPEKEGLNTHRMIQAGVLDVLFNLGADEIDVPPGTFVIYQGTHGDRGAHRADIILPGAAYTEKSGLYVNMEGRVQLAERANFPPGGAREDWAILRALSDVVGCRLPFDNLYQLRTQLYRIHPHMACHGEIINSSEKGKEFDAFPDQGSLSPTPFSAAVKDFYLTNPIARASKIMAECSKIRAEGAVSAVSLRAS